MSEINADDILRPFRAQIDAIDNQLVDLLAQRYDVVRQVGEIKARHALSPVQSGRVKQVLDRVSDIAIQKDLDPAFVRRLYELMIDHAHNLEFGIADDR